jgi:dephospho-CoA kinase
MHIIGILGGVASGKSLVAGQLAAFGAGLLEADRAGHVVLERPEIEAAARARWGDRIFAPDGRIDRGRLAEIVFAPWPEGPQEREYLEDLTHPEIAKLLRDRAQSLAAAGCSAAVLDAPLLLEAGWERLCDTLVYVDAPRPLRMSRAVERGWKEEEFAAREGVQKSLDSKRARADVIIDNSGSPESTRAAVERFWHTLVG